MTPLRKSRANKIDSIAVTKRSKRAGLSTAHGYNSDNGEFAFGDPLKRLERINREVRLKELDEK